jgi:hypothetical protein
MDGPLRPFRPPKTKTTLQAQTRPTTHGTIKATDKVQKTRRIEGSQSHSAGVRRANSLRRHLAANSLRRHLASHGTRCCGVTPPRSAHSRVHSPGAWLALWIFDRTPSANFGGRSAAGVKGTAFASFSQRLFNPALSQNQSHTFTSQGITAAFCLMPA